MNRQYNHKYKEMDGGPPPLDESWWEAVLAEDKAHSPPPQSSTASQTQAPAIQSPAPEPSGVDWELAEELFSADSICHLKVTGFNRGGLLVSTDGLQGFVPVSHLVELRGDKIVEATDEWADAYLGQSLKLKIIECDRERGRVVLSERAAMAESGSRNQLLQGLRGGMCVSGTVSNITDFGVFVDLGGVEGLIHVSEISWGRVSHPSDVVRYGENLSVYVISVDPKRSRVALSLKRLSPNPWETAEQRYHPGLVAEAVITSIVPFGIFARLEEGLDGLIHISEIYQDSELAPLDELFYEGQKVKVRVLHVDAANQRLGLSTIIEL